MIRVSHHLLLCATPSKALCCPDPAIGVASWNRLKQNGGRTKAQHAESETGPCMQNGTNARRNALLLFTSRP